MATIPADEDEVDRWVKEQNAKGRKCACGCGRTVAVLRRHYWMGLPKFHGECRHKAMQAKRARVTGDKYINGTELAKKLGIGRSTLKRRVEAGKLPKPEKSISGMMLFDTTPLASDPTGFTLSSTVADVPCLHRVALQHIPGTHFSASGVDSQTAMAAINPPPNGGRRR